MSTVSNMAVQSGEPPQEIMFLEVSRLENEGLVKAVETWGQPKSRLTHLVFYAISHRTKPGPDDYLKPGPDDYLTELLRCPVCVHHFGYEQGNYHEGTVIDHFRAFANRNRSGLALFLCSEYKAVPTRNRSSRTGPLVWYM